MIIAKGSPRYLSHLSTEVDFFCGMIERRCLSRLNISSRFSDNIGEIKTQIEKIKIQSKNDIGKNDAILKKIKDFKIPDQ